LDQQQGAIVSAVFDSRPAALPQVPNGEYNRGMPRQRILLVDDHEVVRLGLKALIDRRPDMKVVAEAESSEEALTKALAFRPDSIVMDIRLGGGSGIDACREITAQLPATKIIMLTSYAEDEMLFAAIRAGAAGYVLKQAGGQDVLRALEAVGQGQALLDPALTERVFAQVRRAAHDQEAAAFSMLTEQEQRVLALVAKGKTNHEIAQELHLGEGTVRNYVSNILGKLNVANRAEAAAYATQHHLTAPD
jgi:two-component system response regulator DevR